ncbi:MULTISPECIES: hypothetical protein [Bradyrhizobium]|uniref:hypothetical protein n=1 Tax=Bradyrhizobium TaxID=374 RepID=UPI0005577631|nr:MULTISPECIES: hypothetical protein [Bradyrhizobium]UFW51094.1 hypothetical protein BaraCB756_08715 [Bradyrhizobium arachidis]
MIGIFLSYPKPHKNVQAKFIEAIKAHLVAQGLSPQTMTRSNYDMDAPLAGIRRLMIGCCGLLGVAFRRSYSEHFAIRDGADIQSISTELKQKVWLTSPYMQIEPAMAYQLGIPILLMKEKGVLAEGVIEQGVTGQYLPEFDPENVTEPFDWSNAMNQWIGRVRAVYDHRGRPPQLY